MKRVIAVLVGCVLCLAAASSSASEEKRELLPLRDEALMRKHFDLACEAVEEECGARFKKRPSFRILSRRALRKRLLGDGTSYEEKTAAALQSKEILGWYIPKAHRVYVIPDNAYGPGVRYHSFYERRGRRAPVLLAEARILLVHECLHALDGEQHPDLFDRIGAQPSEVGFARQAIFEGHAEWIANRVATRWGIPEGFANLDHGKLHIRMSDSARTRSRKIRTEFAYRVGRQFFEHVFRSEGMGGVKRALAAPPRNISHVERPQDWLKPSKVSFAFDTRRLVGRLTSLGRGPLHPERHIAGLWKSGFVSQSSHWPRADRDALGTGFERGHRLDLSWDFRGARRGTLVARAMVFETVAYAQAFVSAVQRLESGPIAREERTLRRHASLVLDVLVSHLPGYDRALQNAHLDYALDDQDASGTLAQPSVPQWPFSKYRDVTVRVVDSDGNAVPSARAHWDSTRQKQTFAVGSEAKAMRVEDRSGRLTVFEATDDAGNVLPLAPKRVWVRATDADVTVQLDTGVTQTGRVVDFKGRPVANAKVKATIQGNAQAFDGLVHARATSDAHGRFRLAGLGRHTYRVTCDDPNRRRRVDPEVVSFRNTISAAGIVFTLRNIQDLNVFVVRPSYYQLHGGVLHIAREGQVVPLKIHLGRAMLPALDFDRRYRVTIKPNVETSSDVAMLHMEAWRPTELIKMKPGWVLKGTLIDSAGAATAGVVTLDRGFELQAKQTDAQGRFRFTRLPKEAARIAPGRVLKSDVETTTWTSVAPYATEIQLKVNARK